MSQRFTRVPGDICSGFTWDIWEGRDTRTSQGMQPFGQSQLILVLVVGQVSLVCDRPERFVYICQAERGSPLVPSANVRTACTETPPGIKRRFFFPIPMFFCPISSHSSPIWLSGQDKITDLPRGATTALPSEQAVGGHHSLWTLCSCVTCLSFLQVHLQFGSRAVAASQ